MEDWLVAACIRQREFCVKLEDSKYSWYSKATASQLKAEYENFLALVKEHHGTGLLVPTLHEDFVWHAHMQFHESYAQDSIARFGWLLDHKDDIEPNELKMRAEITKDLRKEKNSPTSCGGGPACGVLCAYRPPFFGFPDSHNHEGHHHHNDGHHHNDNGPSSCGGNHSNTTSNCGSSKLFMYF